MALEIKPVENLPEFKPGDDVGTIVAEHVLAGEMTLSDDDVLVVAQKIISKAEGCAIDLDSIEPGKLAKGFAPEAGKDPRVVQAILDQSRRVIKMEDGVIISETRHGFVCANAGIDTSNVNDEGVVLPLPGDPDQSAFRLREQVREATGQSPAVVISDTWGRPWREGQVNFAIGVNGLNPLRDHRGKQDTSGQELTETVIADADELAAAAELVMGKTKAIPVALVTGYRKVSEHGNGRDLVRAPERDFFR